MYSPHPANYGLEPEKSVSYTKINVDNSEYLRLQMNLPPSPPINRSIPDDLKFTTNTVDSMLKDYFEKGQGKGLHIYRPEKGFFEKSIVNYDSINDKWKIKNENPFYENSSLVFYDKGKKKSYLKEMTYDTATGKVEIETETLNFTYTNNNDSFNENSFDKTYLDTLIKATKAIYQRTFEREFYGRFLDEPKYENLSKYDIPPYLNPDFPWIINKEDTVTKKRNKIKRNLTIIVKSRAEPVYNIPENEQIAMETLREMIAETEFRKYLKYGFILVRGRSGCTYQIFRDRAHTKVWKNGKLIKEICVRIKNEKIPPTDNVIAFKVLIEGSEEDFEKLGNVYKMAEAA